MHKRTFGSGSLREVKHCESKDWHSWKRMVFTITSCPSIQPSTSVSRITLTCQASKASWCGQYLHYRMGGHKMYNFLNNCIFRLNCAGTRNIQSFQDTPRSLTSQSLPSQHPQWWPIQSSLPRSIFHTLRCPPLQCLPSCAPHVASVAFLFLHSQT